MRKAVIFLMGMFMMAGCAHDPIIDMRGVDERKFRQDLADCRGYANQVNVAESATKEAAIGAAVGGLIGAAIGDSDTAERIGGAAAVGGAGEGAASAEKRKKRVLHRCMIGRGYRVLG